MAKNALARTFIKSLMRMNAAYSIEVGPIRAQGVPAILVAVTGVVVGAGIARFLAGAGERLPETLGQARGLAETLRNDAPRLNR